MTDVYSIAVDGSGLARLTADDAPDLYPSYSPDGSRLAYLKADGGDFRIYVSNADGTNPVRIAGRGQEDEDPAWSPSLPEM